MSSPEADMIELERQEARQHIVEAIEKEHPGWLHHKARRDRAGGNSADANRDFEASAVRMDLLLDKLGSLAIRAPDYVGDNGLE